MSQRKMPGSPIKEEAPSGTNASTRIMGSIHQRTDSSSSKTSSSSSALSMKELILLTPYPVEPGHTLITILRLSANEWKPEMRSSAAFVAEGDYAGIVINKPASIMDYNKIQAAQKERHQPPNAKMSFKVSLINSETNKLTLEHRTLRFWMDQSPFVELDSSQNRNDYANFESDEMDKNGQDKFRSTRSFANIKQESSQLAQAYFCQLIDSKPDDFPKNYVGFIMKLMRMLKNSQFSRIGKMEVELRQLAQEDHQTKPSSPVSSIDGSQSGRGSPLTSQRILDIIESSYPNPISLEEICSTTRTEEPIVRQLVDELTTREKISTDDGQHFTRTTKPIDTKVNLVKQMPKVTKSQQPVIAIITAQYCEKLAVDAMISDKETFVRYRVSSGQDASGYQQQMEMSSNYVYTLGNIGDHRVVSTKLTSVGHSRGALIAAGNATTRLLGTFPEIEYVFMIGCGGGVANYTDFSSHVRLGDIVVSHLPDERLQNVSLNDTNLSCHNNAPGKPSASDFVYVHCRPKQPDLTKAAGANRNSASIPVSYSVHKNLKRAAGGVATTTNGSFDASAEVGANTTAISADEANISTTTDDTLDGTKSSTVLAYDECHFRLWRPVNLELQQLAQRLWLQGLDNPTQRIWNYYIDEGIETLKHQDIEADRPTADTDKLYMSIGLNDTIEVSHPEAGDDEIDLRREGRPMCHFGPIGSGRPALASKPLKQQMISEFDLRAFDSEFDPVVESIYGNRKECYIMIRGISDYKDGRKKKEWQQYSALVAAAFMKSIIVNLKPLS